MALSSFVSFEGKEWVGHLPFEVTITQRPELGYGFNVYYKGLLVAQVAGSTLIHWINQPTKDRITIHYKDINGDMGYIHVDLAPYEESAWWNSLA